MTDDTPTTPQGQEIIHGGSVEMAALRLLAYNLSDTEPEETPLPTAARQAVERVDELADRVATLENAVETDPSKLSYEQMTKKDKVRLVQNGLVTKAKEKQNGKAGYEYTNVMSLFAEEISAGHAYDLMKLAAQESGFNYQEPDGKANRLVVDLEAVNNLAGFHAVNKSNQTNPA